jgi:hypothetical protein
MRAQRACSPAVRRVTARSTGGELTAQRMSQRSYIVRRLVSMHGLLRLLRLLIRAQASHQRGKIMGKIFASEATPHVAGRLGNKEERPPAQLLLRAHGRQTLGARVTRVDPAAWAAACRGGVCCGRRGGARPRPPRSHRAPWLQRALARKCSR